MILTRNVLRFGAILAAVVLYTFSSVSQAEIEIAVSGGGERAVAKRLTATITAIDYENRDVVLEGPLGNSITIHAGDAVERLEEFQVGDLVAASYIESLSGDLREPTPEEVTVPWVVLGATETAGETSLPAAGAAQVIRAVCTIEGMNRATKTVTVLDPRGYYHVIGGVDPKRLESVTLGQTVIITYTRAVALTLEKHTAD